ncbi:MAG TPA: hypothetical protein VEN79_18025 [Terriglobia bacterium]|nr:hypothetical protein [Terriglobia bacterium]
MTLCWRVAALELFCGLLCQAGIAQNATLEIQPSSISASSSNFTAQARIILKNPGPETLQRLSVSQFSNDGVKAEVGKPCAAVAGPKHEIVWPVKISGGGNVRLPGSIIFEATYVGSYGIQHLYAPFLVQTDGAQKLVEASLEGSLESVSQQRPAAMYLLVTNNMDVPLEVDVSSQAPLPAIVIPPISPFPVFPYSTAARKIDIKADSRVTPGTYPIVIEAKATWNWAGRTEERSFVLSKSATLGVFFESELLKALSVPSFLVLPGCLMVFAFQLLLSFNLLRLNDNSKLPDIAITSPGFWILSVSMSGLFAYVYYWCTGVNYLLSYGVADLINVWVSSIPIGFGVYLAVALLTLRHRRAHIPSSSDKPAEILKKLANNHYGILLPKVNYTLSNVALSGFLIEKIEDGQTLVWVAPHITPTWQATAPAPALQVEFGKVINGNRDPAQLAEILKRAGSLVTAEWDSEGVVPNPYHVKVEAITQYLPADLIVG